MSWTLLKDEYLFLTEEVAMLRIQPRGVDGKTLTVTMKSGVTFALQDGDAEALWADFNSLAEKTGHSGEWKQSARNLRG